MFIFAVNSSLATFTFRSIINESFLKKRSHIDEIIKFAVNSIEQRS
jgi:hypothetical protein